jgi:hypothetical protein
MVDILNKLQTVAAKLFERNDHCSFTTLINIEHGVWKQKLKVLRNSLKHDTQHNARRSVRTYKRQTSTHTYVSDGSRGTCSYQAKHILFHLISSHQCSSVFLKTAKMFSPKDEKCMCSTVLLVVGFCLFNLFGVGS